MNYISHRSTRVYPILLLILQMAACTAFSQTQAIHLADKQAPENFQLAAKTIAPLITDIADAKVVHIAAAALQQDISLVTGLSPAIKQQAEKAPYVIVIGTLGHSTFIDQLAARKLIPAASIKGQWERFILAVVNNPTQFQQKLLVIAGSDPRGTAYGIFELSARLGISPWVWWADAKPAPRTSISFTPGTFISKSPSVTYRGIFINDEDWGLQPWAAHTFEPHTKDIGPKTYAKVFELLLRLKANLIWPAMHPSTKPFFHYPGNKQVAEDYAMIIGTSHAEPMLRNNVGEWDTKTMGDFNYLTNKDRVYKYWEDRIKESKTINAIFSMGMRGVHDSGMEGIKSSKEAVPLIERIFDDQRGLLRQYINKEVTKVPQAFTAYKEVLDIYDNGLQVPDDITIVWPDDNYGYIQRLNNEQEKKRSGGAGVYYHASYWGRPHDYLWLPSAHPGLMREEMMKAWDNNARQLWVVNVGDIKPIEYNMQFFLDMAYDVTPFKDSRYTRIHLRNWSNSLFGTRIGSDISNLLWTYYKLAFERKPEFMGWNQTEPTTPTHYTAWNHFYYGDEATHRLKQYDRLAELAGSIRTTNNLNNDAYFQLVYYPIMGAKWMNTKFLQRDKSRLYAAQNRLSAYDCAQRSQASMDSIATLTHYYNKTLAGGKWDRIMSMSPRELPVFKQPAIANIVTDSSSIWGIAPEGNVPDTTQPTPFPASFQLPAFDNINQQQYFVDVFLTNVQNVQWTAATSAPWISLSVTEGHLKPSQDNNQQRMRVSILWNKVPAGNNLTGQITFTGAGKQYTVAIQARQLTIKDKHYKGYVENNGLVSIYAYRSTSYTATTNSQWEQLEDLGTVDKVLRSVITTTNRPDTTAAAILKNGARLTYDLYTFTAGAPAVTIYTLPTHPLNNNYSMRYAVSLDGRPLQIIDFRTVGRSETWKQNVLNNMASKQLRFQSISPGKHTITLYSIDPGVIVDRLLIDLTGVPKAYSAIPETRYTP